MTERIVLRNKFTQKPKNWRTNERGIKITPKRTYIYLPWKLWRKIRAFSDTDSVEKAKEFGYTKTEYNNDHPEKDVIVSILESFFRQGNITLEESDE
jgi:hypothetical protein